MSALAGILFNQPHTADDARQAVKSLLEQEKSRKGEDRGLWAHPYAGMAMRGHRTIDLSQDGTQPGQSANGRFVVMLDGYIANAQALTRELEDAKIRLRGHGDAELIAEGAMHWGLNRLLQKIEGAFACAIWDNEIGVMHLVRDRFGARPMYITRIAGQTVFASDMKAFKKLPEFNAAINADAAHCYLSWGFVAAPLALYENVIALPAGHRLMLKPDDTFLPKTEAYWSAASALEESALRTQGLDDSNRLDRLSVNLVTGATRLNVAFSCVDDLSPSASMLRVMLDRVSEAPFKIFPVIAPDGASLQTTFDTLSGLSEPVSDPMAVSWLGAFKRCADAAPVAIFASTLVRPNADTDQITKTQMALSYLPRAFHRFLPTRYAAMAQTPADIYTERHKLWPLMNLPDYIEPRMQASVQQRVAYLEMIHDFTCGYLPGLDRIAAFSGLDIRIPLADARALDFGLCCPAAKGNADINTWMRGPLRPKIQDLLKPALFERLSISDAAPFMDGWNAFLSGDNTKSHAIWTLATLLAWTKSDD